MRTAQRERHQTGSIYEASGSFYVRYRVTEIVEGKPTRVQTSERLCSRDAIHNSSKCKAVRALRDEFMLSVNSQRGTIQKDTTVAEFWEGVYLPWAKDVNPKVGEPNLRAATIRGYEQIWAQHLGAHFGNAELRKYATETATEFLTALARTQGRNTIHHVRSLMSGIFRHAVAKGYVEQNPISNGQRGGGAQSLSKTAKPAKTGHYSLQEALKILAALSDYVECQLIMALAFFWGLRPSEIRGLKWEDFSFASSDDCDICKADDWSIEVAHVHVRRAVDQAGNITRLKTDEAEQPLPLMIPIAMPLRMWKEQRGNPAEGWVFENNNGKPTDLKDRVRTTIRPALRAERLKWKGLYAGRRGAATMLLQLTGNALASQQLLRHKPGSAVTAKHYLKAIPAALLDGAKAVEGAVTKALEARNGA
jgi:integrase